MGRHVDGAGRRDLAFTRPAVEWNAGVAAQRCQSTTDFSRGPHQKIARKSNYGQTSYNVGKWFCRVFCIGRSQETSDRDRRPTVCATSQPVSQQDWSWSGCKCFGSHAGPLNQGPTQIAAEASIARRPKSVPPVLLVCFEVRHEDMDSHIAAWRQQSIIRRCQLFT